MNIMLNKTARAGVSEEYHQAFFDPFYPVIGAVSALVLICIVAWRNFWPLRTSKLDVVSGEVVDPRARVSSK